MWSTVCAKLVEQREPLAKPTLNKLNRRKNRLSDLQFRGFARGLRVRIDGIMRLWCKSDAVEKAEA